MIIADTGFWLALANIRDRHHVRAKAALANLKEPLITTSPVVTETCHLLVARFGVTAELAFVRSWVDGAFDVHDIAEAQAGRCHALMTKYQDLPMDFADASLVLLAEALGSGRILSTDERDFRTYRWKHREPFCNLLIE